MPPTSEQEGNQPLTNRTVWPTAEPASNVGGAPDALNQKSVPQARPLLHWADDESHDGVDLQHDDWVLSVAISPDGHHALTASLDSKLKVWLVNTGEEVASFDIGVPARYFSGSPQFSANGTLLFVTGVDGRVYFGPWAESAPLRVLPIGPESAVNRAALAPNNDHIITGHEDGRVLLTALSALDTVKILSGPSNDAISAVAFSADSRYAAAGTRNGNTRVWNLEMPDQPVPLARHGDYVNTVASSPAGDLWATSSDDATVNISDPRGELVAVLRQGDRINSAVFSSDGKLLATACVDKTAGVFDPRTGKRVATVHGHDDELVATVFSHDTTLVATAGIDGKSLVSYARTGDVLFELSGHGAVFAVAFTPDGRRLATASADSVARLRDITTGQVFAGPTGQVNTVAISPPDGQFTATASEDGFARVYRTADGEQVAVLDDHSAAVNSAAFSPDGTRIATSSLDRTVRVKEWQQPAAESEVFRHEAEAESAEFSRDGRSLATSTRFEVKIWDLQTHQPRTTIRPEPKAVNNPFAAFLGVSFSPNSKLVVTSHYDQTARIWNAQTGDLIRPLVGHTGVVYGAMFDRGGRRVVTAGGDCTARVWLAATGRQLQVLVSPAGQLRSAAFIADGQLVVGGTVNGRLLVWRVVNGQLLLTLRQHAALVTSVTASPDGNLLLSSSDDRTAKAVSLQSRQSSLKELSTTASHHERVPADSGP
jgi:WD40 repeat protein